MAFLAGFPDFESLQLCCDDLCVKGAIIEFQFLREYAGRGVSCCVLEIGVVKLLFVSNPDISVKNTYIFLLLDLLAFSCLQGIAVSQIFRF